MSNTANDRRQRSNEDRLSELQKAYEENEKDNATPLAEAYLEAGRPKDALSILENNQDGRTTDLLRAQAHFDLFELDKAKTILSPISSEKEVRDSVRGRLLLGELSFEENDSESAKKHLNQVIEFDPQHRRAAELLRNLGVDVELPTENDAELYAFRTEDEDAESPKRAALQLAAGLLLCVVLVGAYYFSAKKSADAALLVQDARDMVLGNDKSSLEKTVQTLQAAIEIKDTPLAQARLAEAHALLAVDHGLDASLSTLKVMVADLAANNVEKAERYAAEGWLALHEGQPEKAVKIADALRARGGTSEKVSLVEGIGMRRSGKLKEGKSTLIRAQKFASKSPIYSAELGDAYYADGDAINARKFWAKSAQTNASYLRATSRKNLGNVQRGKMTDAATEKLTAALKAESAPSPRAQAYIQTTLGAHAYARGKSREALKFLNEALKTLEQDPILLELKAKAQLAEGKTKLALSTMTKALEFSQSSKHFVYANAELLHEAGKHNAAVKHLLAHQKGNEKISSYFAKLGAAHWAAGEKAKAEKAYKKALDLNKDQPDALLGMGKMALAKNDTDKASEYFSKALGARATFPEVYEAVGMMFIERKDTGNAHTNWGQAEAFHKKKGADAQQMRKFYGMVLGKMKSARASQLSEWVAKEKAFRQTL